MKSIIFGVLGNARGTALGVLETAKADFEAGTSDGANTWSAVITKEMYAQLPADTETVFVMIPGTEWGGILTSRGVDTKLDTITVGGPTWRGMMAKKHVSYPSGSSEELNDAIWRLLSDNFDYILIGDSVSTTGVTSRWRGANHLTMVDAADRILASVGYHMHMVCETDFFSAMSCIVTAVPIQTITNDVNFKYADMQYALSQDNGFVNHLVCLGSGEGSRRTVRHLWVTNDGEITETNPYPVDDPTGIDIREAIFDYPGAGVTELLFYGKRRLAELIRDRNRFNITLDTDREDIELYDIVQCHDPITGITMQASVTGKRLIITGNTHSVEYTLGQVATEDES